MKFLKKAKYLATLVMVFVLVACNQTSETIQITLQPLEQSALEEYYTQNNITSYISDEFKLTPINTYYIEIIEQLLKNYWTIFLGYGWRDSYTAQLYYWQYKNVPQYFNWWNTEPYVPIAPHWHGHWRYDINTQKSPLVYINAIRTYNEFWQEFLNTDFVFLPEADWTQNWIKAPINLYDINNTPLHDPVFLGIDFLDIVNFIAVNFSIVDLNNDGVPELLIFYSRTHMPGSNWDGMGGTFNILVMYTYIYGYYVATQAFEVWDQFFKDTQGNIILVAHSNEYDGVRLSQINPGFYYVNITSKGVTLEPISLLENDITWQQWSEHFHKWDDQLHTNTFIANPTIIFTNEPLTEIYLPSNHAEGTLRNDTTQLRNDIFNTVTLYLRNLQDY